MTDNRFRLLILIYLSFLFSNPLYAASKKSSPTQSFDHDISGYEISLLTFSPTDNLFEWFGHTALAVQNRRTGQSTAYSFGGFSFGMSDFLMFSMGQFTFWSYTNDTSRLVRSYRKRGRHIVIQQLDLTRIQSMRIRMSLMRAMLPQNRYYVYDHFKDNCATRLRDIVDDALDGAIKKQSSDSTGNNIRDYLNRMTAHLPALNFLLNFVLSDGVDRNITYWETMFLPDRLMAVFQGSTNPKTGRPLVKNRSEIIVKNQSSFYSDSVTIPHTSRRDWFLGLMSGLLVALTAWFYLRKKNEDRPLEQVLRKIYPVIVTCFGAVFGLLGVVLFFMTVIASHKDVYWNENFFLLNPVTFTLLPLGVLRLFGRSRKLFAGVSLLCGLVGVVGFCLKLLPAFDQGNGQQLRMLLPMLLLMGVVGLIDLKNQTAHPDTAGNKTKLI